MPLNLYKKLLNPKPLQFPIKNYCFLQKTYFCGRFINNAQFFSPIKLILCLLHLILCCTCLMFCLSAADLAIIMRMVYKISPGSLINSIAFPIKAEAIT